MSGKNRIIISMKYTVLIVFVISWFRLNLIHKDAAISPYGFPYCLRHTTKYSIGTLFWQLFKYLSYCLIIIRRRSVSNFFLTYTLFLYIYMCIIYEGFSKSNVINAFYIASRLRFLYVIYHWKEFFSADTVWYNTCKSHVSPLYK